VEQAAVGVEPTNNGFANRRLRPLGYAASYKPAFSLPAIVPFFKRDKRFFCLPFAAHRQYFRNEKRLTLCLKTNCIDENKQKLFGQ
jgi:hypothetical protein